MNYKWKNYKLGSSGAGCSEVISSLHQNGPACRSSIFQSISIFSSEMESGNISPPLIVCQLQNSKFVKNSITLLFMYYLRNNSDRLLTIWPQFSIKFDICKYFVTDKIWAIKNLFFCRGAPFHARLVHKKSCIKQFYLIIFWIVLIILRHTSTFLKFMHACNVQNKIQIYLNIKSL